jgi:hypothetical protein
LEQWAMNLMLMNVTTQKVGRAVRLPEAGVPAEAGSGLSKSAVSRRVKALTQVRLEEWMASDLSALNLLVIQIDGLHMKDNLLMLGAAGSMPMAASTHWAWSRALRRTRPPCGRCSTI